MLLTSNNTRELSEALKRRCLYLYIDYPTLEEELAIVQLKVPDLAPELARQAVEAVQRLRELELRKTPSISETLDWARALVQLNARSLDAETFKQTMGVLLKFEADLDRVRRRLASLTGGRPANGGRSGGGSGDPGRQGRPGEDRPSRPGREDWPRRER